MVMIEQSHAKKMVVRHIGVIVMSVTSVFTIVFFGLLRCKIMRDSLPHHTVPPPVPPPVVHRSPPSPPTPPIVVHSPDPPDVPKKQEEGPHDDPPTTRTKYRIARVPADGNCFFTSVGLQLGMDASSLRNKCVSLFAAQEESTQTLMVQSEGFPSAQSYMRRLAHGMFGGHNEMILISEHYGVPIHVYVLDKTTHKLKRLTSVRPSNRPTSSSVVHRRVVLLWDGVAHYDAILPQ